MKRRCWKDASLNLKILSCVAVFLLIMTLSTGITAWIGERAFLGFDRLLENTMACYEVQQAIDTETKAFQDFVREASQENQNKYTAACRRARQSIQALPFDYVLLGEERYARTWNLVNGYEGYARVRDAFLEGELSGEANAEQLYYVMEIQEHLSDYALRLTEATLEQSSGNYRQNENLRGFLFGLFLFLFVMAIGTILVIMRLLTRTVIRPLIRMAEMSRKISDNDFSGQDLVVESLDEVGELTTAFNRMKHAMAGHLATQEALHREEVERLQLEKDLDNTRLEVLKSQVDPHFLFNTLNMISCMARMEKARTTDRMIVSLGNLFRYNLRTKEQIVSLEQELEMLDDYFYIQNMRHSGRIQCKKMIEVDPGMVRIPSFMLQPVVENAFTHGLRSKVSDGYIVLRVWQTGRDLMVSVMDNGKGMSPEEIEELKRTALKSEKTGRSIGLGNIYHRMRMLYPQGQMRIYSQKGKGTVVQFRIPQAEFAKGEGECYEI